VTESFSVNIGDLQAMALVLQNTSSGLEGLPGALASRADGPDSSQVIGKSEAAQKYARLLCAWRNNLAQIVTSLDNLALNVNAAAELYAQAETANTPEQAP
jgi:uncharacterized protein YukE